jgi:methionyl-tRNA synthetase
MTRVFVSAGWPYLYEVPGLHNCIPMLFADAVARWRRIRGDAVTFTSGADEHGARVEFVAEGRGTTPRDLVDAKVNATLPLLRQLGLSLDLFGRTTDDGHRRFVMGFVGSLVARGAAERRRLRVPRCLGCGRYLPDRFAEGTCPKCHGPAFGNQCNDKRRCGATLDPFDLIDPHCAVCGGPLVAAEREHLWFSFAPYRERLRAHIEASYADAPAVRERALLTLESVEGMALTRDGSWGAPIPGWVGLPERTVYSWVDALLGKVSTLVALGQQGDLWMRPGAEKVFFLGSDGVPFYAVLLPALLLAADVGYELDGFRIATNDVLVYEGSVCSKSSRTGIWLPEALRLLSGDYWRFVVFEAEARAASGGAARGSADLDFRWNDFASTANRCMGAIDRAYAALAGSPIEPPANGGDLFRRFRESMDALHPGAAFGELLRLFEAPGGVRRSTALAALPLLSCFLPDAAQRAREILGGRARPPLFPELPLDGAALRRAYVEAVAAQRANLDLRDEMTDVRADALCVCPTRLDEE